MTIGTAKPRPRGFALVRDKHGKPRIDGDPDQLAPEIVKMMTPEELAQARADYRKETA